MANISDLQVKLKVECTDLDGIDSTKIYDIDFIVGEIHLVNGEDRIEVDELTLIMFFEPIGVDSWDGINFSM